LCLVLGAWLCLVQGAFAQTGAPRQLVIPFENASREPRVYWLSEGSAVTLTDDLRALGMQPIARDDRHRAFELLRVPLITGLSHATVIRLGQLVGAAQVIVGSFEVTGDMLTVRARTIQLDRGSMSPEMVERGALADLFAVYGRIARRIVPQASVSDEELARAHPPLPAFEQYIKGVLATAPETQVDFLTQALRLDPSFHRARVALWGVHTEAGEHLAALAIVRQVPVSDRLGRQARFLSALSFLNLGQHQEAFNTLGDLHAQSPDAALLNNLGIVQLRRQDTGSPAAEYFRQAIAADDKDSDYFFNLGYAYWRERDLANAINWLREAVRRNPADDAAHYVLGVALQASGSTAEAAREKELARQLSSVYGEWEATQNGENGVPPNLERLKTEIDVLASFRVGDAVVASEQRDQREIAAFHLERGRRFFEEERDAEALAELRRTVFLSPYDADAHLLIARIYLRTGRTAEAIDALKIAVWSDPVNDDARALLDQVSQ
jgi:tetratricopeptide (TPR) repeat protein